MPHWSLLTPEETTALWLSFGVSFVAAWLGLPVAIAIGYFLARRRFPGKWLVGDGGQPAAGLAAGGDGIPAAGPLFLRDPWAGRWKTGSAWIVFTWLAAVLASLAMGFPLMVRAIRLAFQGVDPRLELAARSLGANRITTFATI